MRKIDLFIILFLIILSVFTLKDLFKPNFYTSHDGIHQVVRLYYFDQAIRDGQIPPRWAGGLLNGFGYPLFAFSYHLPWFIAEPIYLSGFTIFESIKLTFLIGFILSGITMYFFQKELFGRLGAFVGTIIYLYAPYRFSNIFVRAAIGDATSFIFPPLLFLSIFRLKVAGKIIWKWIIIGAINLAGILLSHAFVFLFFFLSVGLYIFYSLLFIRKKIIFMISSTLIVILAFGLSSYYLLPSLTERNLTKFSEIMGSAFIGNTFLSFKDLLYSSWGYGMMRASEGGMSFQLGIAQWLVVGIAILLIIFLVLQKKSKDSTKSILREAIFYLLLFLGSLIIMFPISLPFWKVLQNITVVDFTWRVLPVSVFAVSVLAGFVISKIKFPYLVALFIIILTFYSNRNHLRINQILDWQLPFYLQLEKTTNSYDEYTPKWVRNEMVEKPRQKVEFLDGSAEINIIKNKSNYLDFELNTKEKGKVRINTVYYPGWQIQVNNRPVIIDYNQNGLMEFAVDKGRSKIIVKLTETSLRLVSDILTLVTLGFIVFIIIKTKKV